MATHCGLTWHLFVLQGIEPWNKGRRMSEETRMKMRLAKLHRTASKATRRRMSESHRGKGHSQVGTGLEGAGDGCPQ